jgi:hypothetical protein
LISLVTSASFDLRYGAAYLFQMRQQLAKIRGGHMGKLFVVHFFHRLIQFLQEMNSLSGDAGLHYAAIFFLARTRNESARFQTIQQTRDVRITGNHARGDFAAGQAVIIGVSFAVVAGATLLGVSVRAAQNSQDVILGVRKAGRLQHFFQRAQEQIGDVKER